jgi:anti-sigma-K factor RskA
MPGSLRWQIQTNKSERYIWMKKPMVALPCEEIERLLPALALDALNADERAQVVAHLEMCADCRRCYAEYSTIAAGLLDAVPQRIPPPALKQSLMARTQSPRMGWFERWVQSWRNHVTMSRVAPGLAFAMLLVLVTLLGVQVLRLSQQLAELSAQLELQQRAIDFLSDPAKQSVNLVGNERAASASGLIVFEPQDSTGMFYAHDLPPLPASHIYQLWLIDANGQYDSGGVFSAPSGSADSMKLIKAQRPFGAYSHFEVTLEPTAGSPIRTGPLILSSAN